MAEDGLEVPGTTEQMGPRRLMRYRREYLDRLRGQAPDPATQGVPVVVPVETPDEHALDLQRRFAMLAVQGSIQQPEAEEEFQRFVAADGTALFHTDEQVLDHVRQQIFGGAPATGGRAGLVSERSINPAHLSGLSSSDIRSQDYDEHLLGPQTRSVPMVLQPASVDSAPAQEPEPAQDSAPAQRPESAPDAERSAGDGVAADEQDAPSAAAAPGEAGTGADVSRPAAAAAQTTPAPVRPVRAVDAHGLDLSGMDQKVIGSGARWIWLLVLLLVVVGVVLGVFFLRP